MLVPDGRVPSKNASSWLSRLIDKLCVGSKDNGGARCIWGGGLDTTVFTGMVVTLAVTGLLFDIGEGSSLTRGEISRKWNKVN
ncbi:hypothetical protein GDO81_008335 [Engystomops pustulosus]|uniref:Uncharacterized protein n=1 Tax=Engystomops pustulosus TaxID=76066 RepID=A0AAV7CES1_ENGPU|nr:hypothetical protein GDO81_008335 [Engystomops pustulosus]